MRIISHAYPPPPLSLSDLHNDLAPMQPTSPRSAQNHTHADPRNDPHSPFSNSQASLDRDPTTVRNLLPPNHHPPPPHQPQDWRLPPARHNGEQMAPPQDARDAQPSSSKRKLDETPEESQNKIRRIVREHVVMDYARVMTMTTVVCLHAAVAQKSYGSEKRFLCPPPVVRVETPFTELKSQQLSMCIVTENGERGIEQRSPLDHNMVASFKYLHVAGTAKSKSFQLALDICEPNLPASADHATSDSIPGRVWASFDSAPVTIISKPSKKTAKTRNISSCILAGGPVSLFNRINSQTVRTKYMTIEHAQLCASNLSWSAFNVTVTRRHADTGGAAGPQPVTYGSEIQLVDSLTGITTNPLIIRKVDKGKVSTEDGGPVSQMQKIALQRINADGSRAYLSASGPVPGAPVAGAPTPGSAGQPASHPLLFQGPRVRDEVREGVRIVTDEVDDYLCWTIVGISKFQYTFFDALGRNTPVPSIPITPFPTLFTAPAYRPAPHTIELTVSNFFYRHPETHASTPLEVWLGNLGPLRQRIFQATPPGPLTSVAGYGMPSGGPISGEAVNIADVGSSGNSHANDTPQTIVAPPRFVPSGPLHTIIIVDLPPLDDIVKTLTDGMMSLAAGAAEAARMMEPAPSPRSPTQQGSEGRGSRQNDGGSDAQQRPSENSEAGPSAPRAPPGSPPSGLEEVQHDGPLPGQALPLLFIRASDGMGYHSGRQIVCDHMYPHGMGTVNPMQAHGHPRGSAGGRSPADGGAWGAAAEAWSLRVI